MSENKEIAIKVDGVYKDFNLPHEVNNNLKQKILHPFKGTTMEKQHALKDISFEIEKGDFFGIVGRNGSGKSTLLKIIAQIYTPTKGGVTVNGSLTPFIELGVGFNPELTGRENVFLNGAMLGFSKKEMAEMYNEIVEFAELEKFMDQKLKNYSSGMQVRLAFSVAIRAKSDILLLDEVLAVGDINFQKKCFEYFRELKKNKKTVVFVTHSMPQVKEYCNRAILIDNNRILPTEDVDNTLDKYLEIMDPDRFNEIKKEQDILSKLKATKSDVEVKSDKITFDVTISPAQDNDIDISRIAFSIKNRLDQKIYQYNSNFSSLKIDYNVKGSSKKKVRVQIQIKNILSDGSYTFDLETLDSSNNILERVENIKKFTVSNGDRNVEHLINPDFVRVTAPQ